MTIVPEPTESAASREHLFLDIQGFIHRLSVAPSGSSADPWPFALMVDTGQDEAICLVHRDDAEQLVGFFQRHLGASDG